MKTTLDSRRSGPAEPSAVADRPGRRHHLLDDLRGGQVAGQPGLAGRAERAGHPAAGLAGHADGDPVRVAHQHALHQRPVEAAPERLAGVAAIAPDVPDDRQQRRQQRAGQPVPGGGRQVGHRRRVVGEPGEVVRRQLTRPVRGLAQLDRGRAPVGRSEVGEVPRRLAGVARVRVPRRPGASKTSGRVVIALPVSHRRGPGEKRSPAGLPDVLAARGLRSGGRAATATRTNPPGTSALRDPHVVDGTPPPGWPWTGPPPPPGSGPSARRTRSGSPTPVAHAAARLVAAPAWVKTVVAVAPETTGHAEVVGAARVGQVRQVPGERQRQRAGRAA